jgi:Transglycosylase SLT domain
MGRGNLLLVIAAVVPWAIVIGPAIAAQPAPNSVPPGDVAARIQALIQKNARTTELITFADHRQHPVKVVRGRRETAGTTHGTDETVAFPDKQIQPVRIMRSGTVVAAVALSGASALRPIGADVQVVSFSSPLERPVTILRGEPVRGMDLHLATAAGISMPDLFAAAPGIDLDRVAFAVDGAESSHGADPGMWRPEPSGPQGPMQVSAAAASDSGGGDRFDLTQNRQLGRAYLARLYRRYGNWPDTVAAYNWGPGNMDAWIAQGRPSAGLPLAVERYCERVLSDGGVAQGPVSSLRCAGWQSRAP